MVPSDGRVSLIFSATAAGWALIVAQLVIQNGIAVAFPAWVKVTPTAGSGGVEIIGQSLVVLYGGWLLLMVAAVPPGVAGALAFFVLGGAAIPGMTFAVVLLIECYVAIECLGRVFERIDLRDIATAE